MLEGVSLALPPGGTLAVLGRNGVGKTTLLATIMGHTALHAGHIRFAGRDVSTLPPYRRARLGIGLVPQEREIFPSLTVEENLTVAAQPGRVVARPDLRPLSRARLAPHEPRQSPLGRRAADAGDRAGADRQPGAPLDGRAARRPGAGDRRHAARARSPGSGARIIWRCSWSSSMPGSRSNSPKRRSSSIAARSSLPARAASCSPRRSVSKR